MIDWEDHVDILLGADFLRAHRVLFAMSQRKIYLSYLGGEPFGQRRKLEPWIVQEAEAGNGDAQMVLAQMYSAGRAVPKDAALAADWLEKAARGGNPEANVLTGRALMQQGSHEAAVARLRSAVDKLPPGHTAALSLYLARVRNKQADLAKTELAAHAASAGDKAWPAPLADFYLGRITAEALLERARAEAVQARTRTCESLAAMWEWHGAHGDQAAAQALLPQRQQHCAPAAAKG